MKKTLGVVAAALLVSAPALAADAPAYNCDYMPSCEVAPGVYGAMATPAKSKFDLSIGGFVKLDYAYNSLQLGTNGFLLPGAPGGSLAAGGTATQNQEQSEFTARQSRFWLKVAGPTFLGAKTNALIEADFAGTSTSDTNVNINENGFVRMRHAYGTLDWANTQVLFGQTNDIFGPAIASTIDFRQGATFGTPNNPRVAQIRLTQKVPFNADNSLKLVLGVQNPVQDVTTPGADGTLPNIGGQIMFVSKALGTAPGFYGMSMNSLQIGGFGLFGNQRIAGNTVDIYGYGVYAFVPVLKSKDGKNRTMTASLEAQGYISAGMNFNGANINTTTATNGIAAAPFGTGGQASSLVGAAPNQTAAKGYGAYGQLIFYPTQDLGITAGYERRNALNYHSYPTSAATQFEAFNELIYGNIAYDLNAAVRVAAEYEHAKTQYNHALAGQSDIGQANIARLAAYYFF